MQHVDSLSLGFMVLEFPVNDDGDEISILAKLTKSFNASRYCSAV